MTTAAAEGNAVAPSALITLDGPTLAAAVVSLLFTVGVGMALSMMPAAGPVAGALDALKNLTYVLSIPVFDISRRLLVRRQVRRTHEEVVSSSRNIFFVVFVSALLLFAVTEVVSFLVGYGMGFICSSISQAASDIKSGDCFRFSLETMGAVLILPIMLAIGIACGWIWYRLVRGRFWLALLICAVIIGILFTIDLVWALRALQHEMLTPMIDQLRNLGVAVQVAKQVAVLSIAIMLGYSLAAFWSKVTRFIS